MPHGFWGIGWGEVVSLFTLIMVIANYIKSGVSRTAHESNRKDMEDLNSKLTDFKINVSELSSLLRQLNRDLANLTKRVDKSEDEIEKLKIDMTKVKEHLEGDNYDNNH